MLTKKFYQLPSHWYDHNEIILAIDLLHVVHLKQFCIFFWLERIHEQRRLSQHLMIGNNGLFVVRKPIFIHQITNLATYTFNHLLLWCSWERRVLLKIIQLCIWRMLMEPTTGYISLLSLFFSWSMHWLGYYYNELWFHEGDIFFSLF